MSEPRRITSEDLALFAMQLLSREETAEVAAYLEQSEEARKELAEIQGDLAIYAHTVDMQSPSAQSRERLMNQVAREKKAIPIDRAPEREISGRGSSASTDGAAKEGYGRGLGSGSYLEDDPPKRGFAGKVLPWVGWAAAAGLAVTTGNLYRERDALRSAVTEQTGKLDHLTADAAAARQLLDAMTDNSALRVTLTTKGTPPAEPQGRATYITNKGTLIFTATNLEPLQPEKTYELWLIPSAAGEGPIPAGTFRPDARGNASVIMPPLPKGIDAKAFGVTVEDEGGASTPTLPIILVGAAAGA
jgi:NTP pyrophosphatase (non-canonical NTP hydrolase)